MENGSSFDGHERLFSVRILQPPDGYGAPCRGPLYLPPSPNTLVLVGRCWCRAIDQVKTGGGYWIFAVRETAADKGSAKIQPTTAPAVKPVGQPA